MRVRGLKRNEFAWSIRWVGPLMTRMVGRVPTPYTAMAHSPRTVFAMTAANAILEGLKHIPDGLKRLVCLRAAQLVGCVF